MKLRWVIFDFDGTLCDSFNLFLNILDKLASVYRFKDLERVNVDELRDLSSRDVMMQVGITKWKLPFILIHARWLFSKKLDRTYLYPGVVEQLALLKQSGKNIGLLTNNSRNNVKRIMGETFSVFDAVYDKVGIFSKMKALNEFCEEYADEIPKPQIAYVGDETRDMDAAKALGMKAIAVAWGYNSQKALQAHHPTFILNSIEEMTKLHTL
jgi:phosphoglycolate phosphatase-like HAD superfamily hydrolase